MKTANVMVLMLALSNAVLGQTVYVSTLAGYAGKGATDGGQPLFSNPQGVAVDAAGNVYVTDTGNNTIRMIEPNGVSRTLAGQAGVSGSADGQGSGALFNQPAGIAVDGATNIYVSDYGNNTIREVTLAGEVTTIAGAAGVAGSVDATGTNASFWHPLGLALDANSNLYVADYGNDTIRVITPTHAVTTFAGTAGNFGFTNGTGSGAQFYEPEGVAVDSSGNVYVADTGNGVIRKISSGGVVTTLAGSPVLRGSTDATGTNALFAQPAGIAVDGAGNLWVVDCFNVAVRYISSAGLVTTVSATTGARLWGPQGIAISGQGVVYIADTANSTIREMTNGGGLTTFAGSSSAGSCNGPGSAARFHGPRNLAVDSANNIYIADSQNSVVRMIAGSGNVSVLAGAVGTFGSADGVGTNALFSGPQGTAVDSSGNVYVADTGNCTIRRITPGCAVSTLAGLAGNPGNADGAGASAQFNEPEGLAVDSSNNVYVADTWNHTVRKITPGGAVCTLAGMAGTFGSFDGTNGGARFNCPTSVAVDSSGNVYVTDYNNNAVRVVTPAGVVITLAGYPGEWGSTDGANSGALFFGPAGISVDRSGNVYVTDSGNSTVREISPSGNANTIAGMTDNIASGDGLSNIAGFYYPSGIAVGGNGNIYIGDTGNNTIRLIGSYSSLAPTSAIVSPASQSIAPGGSGVFSVTANGVPPLGYQWEFDGAAVMGATMSALSLSSVTASNAGQYTVVVSNSYGMVTSGEASLAVAGMAPVFIADGNEFAGGEFHFGLAGLTGDGGIVIEASTNLAQWMPIATNSPSYGTVQFIDAFASNFAARYYRAVIVSP